MIEKINAREIYDSRGNKTIEVDVKTNSVFARASVPSGKSTGKHEAVSLKASKAVANVKKISRKLIGKSVKNQYTVDDIMNKLDGTSNKRKLGANAILGVSMAVCKAAALEKKVPLYEHIASLADVKRFRMPVPCFNVINGGAHAGNDLDFQEYMVMPVGVKSFDEAMKIGTKVYHELQEIIKKKYGSSSTNVGDEGGFAPDISDIQTPIRLIIDAAKKANCLSKIRIGLDVAASSFVKKGKYYLNDRGLTGDEMVKMYASLVKKYPIVSIEDPFAEDDFENFEKLTSLIGKKVQIVGDDLLVTNMDRIAKAVSVNACNSLLLKVNQIGTVSEAIEAAKMARQNSWGVMVSHRSGETTDDFIADLAVGLNTGQIKSGAPCRSERLAKYNRLLRIEEDSKLRYAGKGFRR